MFINYKKQRYIGGFSLPDLGHDAVGSTTAVISFHMKPTYMCSEHQDKLRSLHTAVQFP